jgi:hypothetical protein
MSLNSPFRFLSSLSLLAGLLVLASCNNELDIPDVPLAGKVAGEDWQFAFMSRTPYSADKSTFYFFSTLESIADPCAVFSSSKPHLRVILPLAVGSYGVGASFNPENLKFVHGNGTELDATSGFIEIFAIDYQSRRIAGYIQALSDENNTVQGRFVAELCF